MKGFKVGWANFQEKGSNIKGGQTPSALYGT